MEKKPGLKKRRPLRYSLPSIIKAKKITDPQPIDLIKKEIREIQNDFTLFKVNNYSVFCTPSDKIPVILKELGRLRETTFREIGEGTNKSLDIDKYDAYYYQMFIWNEESCKIIGAYRLGKGQEIISHHGKKGFYIHSLFRINKGFDKYLSLSIELGRSFVIKEYQKKSLPLFLLWKGILYFLLKNKDYRYLIGPVSISNSYNNTSKDLMVKFILANHFDIEKAKFIKPRKKYRLKTEKPEMMEMIENVNQDINLLDKQIENIDAKNPGLPVLLKKYINLNAKIIGFNVDPKFNRSLDGLIFLDISRVPEKMIESLSKELDDSTIYERFYESKNGTKS